MNKVINLGGQEVAYELERKKVKNINLRIRYDCSIYVSANDCISDSMIEKFLQKKSAHILSALHKFTEIVKYADNNYSYVTGENFRYLGRDMRLIVTQGKNNVSTDGVYLNLSVADIDNIVLKKNLIDKWYDTQCRKVFPNIITETFQVFKKYDVKMPRLSLRDMISRWGSCQPKKGAITLNKRLIETPRNAIEYVVMHEFIHFLYPNHSNKFYEMFSTLMPDWKTRKNLLETTTFNASELIGA
jgi:predicted metal-dependent hydrolase